MRRLPTEAREFDVRRIRDLLRFPLFLWIVGSDFASRSDRHPIPFAAEVQEVPRFVNLLLFFEVDDRHRKIGAVNIHP